MAVALIKSTDPKFSFHLRKNPNNGMTIKSLRSGVLSGWYPTVNADSYALWFKELSSENSFSAEEGKNYLDLTQYSSTYFIFSSLSTFFNHALKSDPEQEVHTHSMELPLVQLRTEKTIHHLNKYIGLDYTIENINEGVERMSIYKINIQYTGRFNEFLMKVYLLFYLLHADLHQSDIVWMEGMIAKVVSIIKDLNAPYFLRYWFKKNVLVKENYFNNNRKVLETDCPDGTVKMTYGDTQISRKRFMASQIGLDLPVLDVGCGDGDYFLPYAKKMKPSGQRIVGIDIDERLTSKLREKIEDRKLTNATVLESLNPSVLPVKHDIIFTEVMEHMEIDEAKALIRQLLNRDFRKLVITTPNRSFNQFYPTLEGFRHDDHHFEFNEGEFECFVLDLLSEVDSTTWGYKFHGIGDTIDGIAVTQAVVIERD